MVTTKAGKIVKQNEDFSFMIHFDDGDVEDGVEWNRIEPLNEAQFLQRYKLTCSMMPRLKRI